MLTEAVHLLKPSFLFVTFPLLWLWRGLKTSSIKKENLIVRTCVTYDNWAFDWRAFRFGRCRRSSAAVQLQKPIIIIVFFFFFFIVLFIYLEGLGRGIQGKKKKKKRFFFFLNLTIEQAFLTFVSVGDTIIFSRDISVQSCSCVLFLLVFFFSFASSLLFSSVWHR